MIFLSGWSVPLAPGASRDRGLLVWATVFVQWSSSLGGAATYEPFLLDPRPAG